MGNNVEVIKKQLKEKLKQGEEDFKIVIALVTIERMGLISVKDIKPILRHVFDNNQYKILTALIKAEKVIDKELIDNLIKDT